MLQGEFRSAGLSFCLSERQPRGFGPGRPLLFRKAFTIVLSQRPTPAKMSQEAAAKLPRYALAALLIVFILCGLWARDLWTLRDALAFGLAQEMADGGLVQWLLPSVTGVPIAQSGPLAGWISAVFIRLFDGCLSEVSAYRLSSAFWFAVASAALWYGTWSLARRPEAQPLAFAFGGEAAPRDYSRVVADSAVLLYVATFGIVTRQHEAIPDTVLLALAALNFYGLARTLKHPYAGTAVAGLSAALAVLASTLFAGVWLLAASIIANAVARAFPGNRDKRLALLLITAALPPALWIGAASLLLPEASAEWFVAWAEAQSANFGLVNPNTLAWLAENFIWYLCPIWPLVAWGLYSWRRQLDRTHLFVPLVLMGSSFFAAFFSSSQSADIVFLDFIPSMAAFAAFGLITVKRNRENLLDWFSLSAFTLAVLTLWAYWGAWTAGFPPKMAHSIEMLAPNAAPLFDSGFAASAVVTLIWFGFVGWRATHRPVVAWRGPWLAALGMTTVACVLIGLYHDAIDDNRSYKPVALEVMKVLDEAGLEKGGCVDGSALPPSIRVLFSYYGRIPFAESSKERLTCRFRILRDRTGVMPENLVGFPASRPHTDESFYVLPGPSRR